MPRQKPSTETEKTAIDALKRGDIHDAFEILFELYFERILNRVSRFFRRCPDVDPQDVCQEVWIKVFRELDGFEFRARFYTWIHRIAQNTCINWLKTHRSGINRYIDRSGGDETADRQIEQLKAPTHQRPDVLAEQNEQFQMIHTEIRSLPPKLRQAFCLFECEGHTHQQVAEQMNCSAASVRKYVYAARDILIRRLGQVLDE